MSKLLTIFLTVLYFKNVLSLQENLPKRKLKVLVDSPAMAFSHMQFVGRLADVLAEAGHEVHMVILNVDPKFDNYTGANKANKIIRVDRPESRSKSNAMDELIELDNPFLGYNNALNGFLTWTKLEADNCEAEVFYDENGASKIKSILDNSASGVVLLSFGSLTNTSKMTYQMKKSYLTAFAHFPTHDFIWKLKPGDNETAMFASVPNVHLVDWLNQKAILEHPNLKVFMTHCGMNSMNEVALAGVPVIALPLFGDQLHNAAVTVNKKIGVYAPIDQTDDPQILIDALNKVLNQPKYKENAKLLQKKLKISPFTPEEKFVKWVEFAAEFPNLNELNLPFDELGFLAYYCLDVIFVAIIMTLFLVVVIFVGLKAHLIRLEKLGNSA